MNVSDRCLRRAWAAATLLSCPLWATETLRDFRPSADSSPFGATSHVKFETGLLTLEPGSLAQHTEGAMRHYSFGEPVWVIGYQTEVVDAAGREVRENHVCHTFFGDQMVDQRSDREIVGVYSDHYTHAIRLPEGFGLYFAADETLHWMAMFNNRADRPVRVRMKAIVTLIRERDRRQAMQKLYSTLRSVQVPHLYFVPPGRHEQSAAFELTLNGRVHYMGAHLHPHGVSIELVNSTRRETVWKESVGTQRPAESGVGVYSSAEGYAVSSGDKFRLTAVYDNPTRDVIDAMAGLYLFYTRN